jgi:hypothetical protein
MGNHLGVQMIKAMVAMRRSRLREPHQKPTDTSETGKPPRARAKIKAARKQNVKRKKGQ